MLERRDKTTTGMLCVAAGPTLVFSYTPYQMKFVVVSLKYY